MDDLALSAAPDPAAVPSLPSRTVAYTDLEREGVLAEGAGVTVHEVRVDGVGAALAETDGRGGLSGRALAEAVDSWGRVADLDAVADVLVAGKKPRPWVVAERPPLPLGVTARSEEPDVPTTLDHALWVGAHLARSLATAHDRGVVHGALTPTTVRCWPSPGETWPLPRIGDWGLAPARLDPGGSATGETPSVATVGITEHRTTPADSAFYAPERASGRSPDATPAADVYGLGALLYWLLTGETAHDGVATGGGRPVPPSTIAPTLPGAVDDTLLPAVAVDPGERPTVGEFRTDLVDLLRTETGAESTPAEDTVDPDDTVEGGDLPSAFPLFDGSRADWRAPCPACGRSVNNTVRSFVDHWVDAERCTGPPSAPPATLSGLNAREYGRVLARVESLQDRRPDDDGGIGDHPLVAALADDGRTVLSVGGVDVRRADGAFPWLDQPGRGWRVPCPDCGETVFNALAAFRSHWADAADCEGPPDSFRTR